MNRELHECERALVTAMIRHASANDGSVVTEEDRSRWLAQVDSLRVTGVCGCGVCPSIEFNSTYEPETRLWLEAEDNAQNAMIMLFIDDDELSYLEVCPIEDHAEDSPLSTPTLSNVTFY